MLRADVTQLTSLIEDLTTQSPRSSSSNFLPAQTQIQNQNQNQSHHTDHSNHTLGTPSRSRFLGDANYATPLKHSKEGDDTNRPDGLHSLFSKHLGRPPVYAFPSPRRTRTSANPMHASNAPKIEEHLYTRGYLEGACSDIKITAFEKSYALHKIILDRSPFFSTMFSGPWADSQSSFIDLGFDDPNITKTAFETAVMRLYGYFVPLETIDPLSLLATASYLDLADLTEVCVLHILGHLSSETVVEVVKFASSSCTYGATTLRLVEACKALLCRDGWEMGPASWDGVPGALCAEVIGGDGFYVPNEAERYRFLVSLIQHRLTTDKTKVRQGDQQRCSSLDSEREDGDVDDLRRVLETEIYYMHMSYMELKGILADGIVSKAVVHKALWDQMSLRETTLAAQRGDSILGITVPASSRNRDDDGDAENDDDGISRKTYEERWKVPGDDTNFIGDPPVSTSSTPTVAGSTDNDEGTHSIYPPYRFSVEFSHVASIPESTRIYSHTVFYAGSHWNIYIQKVRPGKSLQLGVYLHRAKDSEAPSVLASSHLASLHRPLSSHSDATNDRHTLTGTRKATPAELDASYIDTRTTVRTWFKIFCPTKQGSSRLGMTEFCSGPDIFHQSQSWGWKSSSLYSQDERDRDRRLGASGTGIGLALTGGSANKTSEEMEGKSPGADSSGRDTGGTSRDGIGSGGSRGEGNADRLKFMIVLGHI